MRQVIFRVVRVLIKCFGVITLFTGLALVATHNYFWGLLVFALGITTLGLHEEGWDQ